VFLCLVALAIAGVFVVPRIIGGEEEPTAALVPATEAPTTEAPTAESPTATPWAETPTATPSADTPTPPPSPPPTDTPLPPTPSPLPLPPPLADVRIAPLASELRVGEWLTITVTVTNTGETPFGHLRYQLLGQWEPSLRTMTPPVVLSSEMVDPGMSTTATFVLEAVQAGTTTLQVAITMETPGAPPRPGGEVSESISVSVVR